MTDFTKTREMFDIPAGMIYLNGNSLGPMPKEASTAMARFLHDEWKTELIKGWNTKNWFMQTNTLGDRLGRLIGAAAGTTVVSDTLSIKVFQAVASGFSLVPDRRVILSDNGNFPTDLYMVEGLMKLKNKAYELRLPNPEDVVSGITDEVAVVMLTEVDYRSGRKHDMKAIIKKAHSVGAPDIMRFGITPLFIDDADIRKAASILEGILTNETWKEARFQVRAKVT